MKYLKLLIALGYIDKRNYEDGLKEIKRLERRKEFYKFRMSYFQKAHSLEELKPLLG